MRLSKQQCKSRVRTQEVVPGPDTEPVTEPGTVSRALNRSHGMLIRIVYRENRPEALNGCDRQATGPRCWAHFCDGACLAQPVSEGRCRGLSAYAAQPLKDGVQSLKGASPPSLQALQLHLDGEC